MRSSAIAPALRCLLHHPHISSQFFHLSNGENWYIDIAQRVKL